jgi:cobalt/nickel transport system permease protein
MHVPDGFLDAPTSVATGVVAAAGVGLALRKARAELDDRTAPMAARGHLRVRHRRSTSWPRTSGHLLVGRWPQSWSHLGSQRQRQRYPGAFADGGITALGTITLMSLVGLVVGWLVFHGLQRLLPKRVGLVPLLAAVGAFVSVPAAALAFTGLYAVGGTAPIPLDALAAAMLGWHTLIGVGEAVITGLVVGSVVAVRPDLVYGARPALAVRTLEIRSDAGASA